MASRRSIALALALPVLVACCYLLAYRGPRTGQITRQATPPALSADRSAGLWEQSTSLVKQGKYAEALPPVLQLYAAYPTNHLYSERAAEIYDKLGDYRHEAQFWEKYLDNAPNPETGCPQIGQAYLKAQDKDAAIGAFERCLAFAPKDPDAMFFLAHALERAGELTRAARLYEQGLKFAPNYDDLRIGLARVRLRQGETNAAEREVGAVLRKHPNNVDALLAAGLVYAREGQLAKAQNYLAKGSSLSEGYMDFHIALASIAEEKKDYAEAIRQYDLILRDDPQDQATRAKLDALRRRR